MAMKFDVFVFEALNRINLLIDKLQGVRR